ncbi:hypothetical protein NP233_g1961 [Leucocoprinus birnbaumii]|uniref:DUF833-domain-containing protein n=1 Tax=Leucocoprinus birnbaumii TaxID=56174 RepID=A0AAD5VZV0_9AGAR|nr:hypothetical protein NP233_g1961 [Leucocoprinus birnbaumii]
MCIGAWTLEHPAYALILCTNRDEYLDRPTQDAHFHSFGMGPCPQSSSNVSGNILSGRDVKAGGSWFGLNRAGRVALLTNITEPPNSFTSSRGYLVSSFLLSDSSSPLEDELGKVVPSDAKFAGFNLLLLAPAPPSASTVLKETGTLEGHEQGLEPRTEEARPKSGDEKLSYDAILVTNHGAGGHIEARRLIPAERYCGCMSNGIDGQGGNDWPKVKRASSSLQDLLKTLPTKFVTESDESQLVEKLFHILTWRSPDPVTERAQLRNTIQVTPIPIILKPDSAKDTPSRSDSATTSGSVSVPDTPEAIPPAQPPPPLAPGSEHYYGTRLSTVLLVRRDDSVLFVERDIWRLGKDGKPERLDYGESRGESEIKQRVFEFKLDLKW